MRRILAGLLATAAAGTAWAQQPILEPKLAELQPAKYTPALCPIKAANKRVEKGLDLLKKSFDTKTPAEKTAALEEAKQNLTAAITQEAQDKNSAAWYYLARVYLQQGDVGGVDSAFAKAQAITPSCEIDINQYRQNNWAQLANAGLELQKKGDIEGALRLFRDASRLFHGLPHVLSNMGVLYANSNQNDSAAVYFAQALEIAEKDTALKEDRNATALNLALMLQRLEKHKEAIGVLHKYLAWDPKNPDARKALSQSFRGAGMADSAAALDNAMVEEMSKTNLDSLDTQDLMAVGVASFNAQRYKEAATAFDKALKRNPYSRDAIYNLANSYLAMTDHQKLVETATKLVELEPMNEDALRLLGQGQKGLKQDDAVLKTAEKLVGLLVTIDVTSFQLGKSGARLIGTATGRSPTDGQGKPIKPAPVALVIEFLTSSGSVVDTKEAAVPLLAPGATHQLNVEAKGEGIQAWRYKSK